MSTGSGSGFGPNPWQQTSWDWRAAGNFIFGGMGTGLLLTSALFGAAAPASLGKPDWLVFAGLALVGLGLLCVWLEIGRPLRALHVFLNPQTSWMSREAFVGLILFPSGLAAMLGVSGWAWVTAALAMVFLYCQACMLPAARGIPAWRVKSFVALMLDTGLCEGCGVFLLLGLWHQRGSSLPMMVLALLIVSRMAIWRHYRSEVRSSLVLRANAALDQAGRVLLSVGTVAPLLLLAVAASLTSGSSQALLVALAGAGAAAAGAYLKFMLVTRASYNQGFALVRIPVRGVRVGQ